LNLMYLYISTFRSVCAVSTMAVFWSSLTSCFPGMLLMHFLTDFEIVPVAPVITGITFYFTFHMRCISIIGLYILESSSSYYYYFFVAFAFVLIVWNPLLRFIYSVRKFYAVNFTYKETTPSIHSAWNRGF